MANPARHSLRRPVNTSELAISTHFVTENPGSSAMKTYYFDNVEGDQRLPHFNPDLPPVGLKQLEDCGVRYWHIPIDSDGNWEQAIDKVAEERSYKNRDIINVSEQGLGDQYEAKLKIFFAE
ncbi:1,2-dihydroxy-3-keto-5-methylthiopentene dioxygenase [Serendipita sp. 399]|nr:1,2-dihydroxy-3-keto-5-methylthiopentene dioxygenase [Serendipita sp. 399]